MRLLITILFIVPLHIMAQETSGVYFEKALTWDQILRKAQSENKFVFIDAYTTWCAPCKQMELETFSNDSLGTFMNGSFISVRLQMDSSSKDDQLTKSNYSLAHAINAKYKLQGYPSFLFFDAGGNLVYRGIGFKDVSRFAKSAKNALDPQNETHANSLALYLKGEGIFKEMPGVCLYVKNVLQDKKLSDSIAKDLIHHYFDTVSDTMLEDRRNRDFVETYSDFFLPGDRLFELCNNTPAKFDSIFQAKGLASDIIGFYIMKVDINDELFDGAVLVNKNPNWTKINHHLSQKYPNHDVRKTVLEYELFFYRNARSWEEWGSLKTTYVTLYPPVVANLGVYTTLNLYGAWDAFLHCNDDKVLYEALHWIDLAISYNEKVGIDCQYRDTKASLLYKMGEVDSAIIVERQAFAEYDQMVRELKLSPDNEGAKNPYTSIIADMQKRLPVYISSGAIWDDASLRKIKEYRN